MQLMVVDLECNFPCLSIVIDLHYVMIVCFPSKYIHYIEHYCSVCAGIYCDKKLRGKFLSQGNYAAPGIRTTDPFLVYEWRFYPNPRTQCTPQKEIKKNMSEVIKLDTRSTH